MPALGECRPIYERFWEKVRITGDDTCWLWTASQTQEGYGRFRIGDRKVLAHRYAWEDCHGRAVPSGKIVRHTCDRPSCCRPDHLLLGTASDNMRDMVQRGRAVKPRAKLTAAQVAAIRDRYMHGEKIRALAEEHGVKYRTIWMIVRYKHWHDAL